MAPGTARPVQPYNRRHHPGGRNDRQVHGTRDARLRGDRFRSTGESAGVPIGRASARRPADERDGELGHAPIRTRQFDRCRPRCPRGGLLPRASRGAVRPRRLVAPAFDHRLVADGRPRRIRRPAVGQSRIEVPALRTIRGDLPGVEVGRGRAAAVAGDPVSETGTEHVCHRRRHRWRSRSRGLGVRPRLPIVPRTLGSRHPDAGSIFTFDPRRVRRNGPRHSRREPLGRGSDRAGGDPPVGSARRHAVGDARPGGSGDRGPDSRRRMRLRSREPNQPDFRSLDPSRRRFEQGRREGIRRPD